MKQILLALSLQLFFGIAFSQEEDPIAKAPEKPLDKLEEGVFEVVDRKPEFPGGVEELKKFVASNLKYVKEASDMQVRSNCYLKLIILETGEISAVKILMRVEDCGDCDQEAIRMVKSMPKWKPAELNGKPVKSIYKLSVPFIYGSN